VYQQKVHHLPTPQLSSAKRHFRYVILPPTVSKECFTRYVRKEEQSCAIALFPWRQPSPYRQG